MAYLGSVFIGSKGMGNSQLNLASSTDGRNFGSKYTSEEMSFDASALCVHHKHPLYRPDGHQQRGHSAVWTIGGGYLVHAYARRHARRDVHYNRR